jgi:hypothetical protein
MTPAAMARRKRRAQALRDHSIAILRAVAPEGAC